MTAEEKIPTSTIPGLSAGTLQHYAESVGAVRKILLSRGRRDIFAPIDTVGVPVFQQQHIWLAKKSTIEAFHILPPTRGDLIIADVRPATYDLRIEASRLLLYEFDRLASKLAIESATAQEAKETTRSIGSTVLDRVTSVRGVPEVVRPASVECRSTARSLLKYATGWAGDDLPALLKQVRRTRSKSSF